MVILLTDGVNNRGEIAPLTAAEIAKTYGVRVYTIGVGAMGTAPYPVMTPFGVQVRNIPVEIDEKLLEQIAEQTGGSYFRATDNTKLLQIYGEIKRDGEGQDHRRLLPRLYRGIRPLRCVGPGRVPA